MEQLKGGGPEGFAESRKKSKNWSHAYKKVEARRRKPACVSRKRFQKSRSGKSEADLKVQIGSHFGEGVQGGRISDKDSEKG